jgi:predicted DNA-binding transcriptional regulator AlpA
MRQDMDFQSNSRRVRTANAAEHIGLAESTLEKDRITGRLGIPYHKLGRTVVYDLGELDSWLASTLRHSTSDTGSMQAA